ncbi:MAG: ABC transporter ATP-binding protein [Nitrososphaeria archaeon]
MIERKNSSKLLLSVQNLKIQYRKKNEYIEAVEDVSFNIDRGKVVALVGESGSGKTTTALAIPNLLPANAIIKEGVILYKGKNLIQATHEELRAIRGKEIGMVFQDPTSFLDPLMRVGDQVAEVIVKHESIKKKEAILKAKNILEKMRVTEPERIYYYYPHQLSGGMAQRVVIGMAIACQPSLLIADEPTSNLDLTVQAQILNLLKALNHELGMSILLISHDLGVVSGIADRVVIMYAGRIMEEGDVHSIFKNPRHPYTRALLVASELGEDMVKQQNDFPSDLLSSSSGCCYRHKCPYVMERCKENPIEILLDQDSRVYCWLYSNES